MPLDEGAPPRTMLEEQLDCNRRNSRDAFSFFPYRARARRYTSPSVPPRRRASLFEPAIDVTHIWEEAVKLLLISVGAISLMILVGALAS